MNTYLHRITLLVLAVGSATITHRLSPQVCVYVCVRRGFVRHGCVGLAEEPVHPAAPHRLRICGQRSHPQLHSAVHLRALANQQAALPQDQHPLGLFAMEP